MQNITTVNMTRAYKKPNRSFEMRIKWEGMVSEFKFKVKTAKKSEEIKKALLSSLPEKWYISPYNSDIVLPDRDQYDEKITKYEIREAYLALIDHFDKVLKKYLKDIYWEAGGKFYRYNNISLKHIFRDEALRAIVPGNLLPVIEPYRKSVFNNMPNFKVSRWTY